MIIPIFVPHKGCPNDCAFCNQRTISGKEKAPTVTEAEKVINEYLKTAKTTKNQIAFFGGSFTGINTFEQNEYLSLANSFIKKGAVESIRISTRPDYIDEDTVKRLISYGVKNIELGAQSMDEEVLLYSKRGHNSNCVEKASEIILKNGAVLGLQMMTGLPKDSYDKCMKTAKKFLELGAKETRIYPTVVLKGTLLEKMYYSGEYIPQSVEEAVETGAGLKEFFDENSISVLRIGLPESETLKENYIAGAYHPALGELVFSRIIRNKIEKNIKNTTKCIEIRANPKLISKIVGNRKCNINYFKEKGIEIQIIKAEINDYSITVI
ncbi:MAG: radical SAM protein [Clostridia bacterium]|nr:radical SAM protein [Clostridia bacterium]